MVVLEEEPFLPIYMSGPDIGDVELDYVKDAMLNGWYGKSAYSYVERFEREFAVYHDRNFGLMTPNCTSAIHLVLSGLGIGKGDEVIVPESTWIGSSAAITYVGADTVFSDIETETWCVSAETVETEVSERTRALIAVDLYGNMPNWTELENSCSEFGFPIIEDAAEALGSVYHGRRAGKFGVASVFSFHRTKTISTGEGGMLLLDDRELFERCRFLRDHGREPGSYFNTEVAYKYMPSNVQAALGYGQFTRIDELIEKKRATFHLYRELLPQDGSIQINLESEERVNGAWATTVVFSPETKLTTEAAISAMAKKGIPLRPFFYPLSSLPAYAMKASANPERHPVAYDIAGRGVHLPCALNLTVNQIEFISQELGALIKEGSRG